LYFFKLYVFAVVGHRTKVKIWRRQTRNQ